MMHILVADLDGCETQVPATLSPTIAVLPRGRIDVLLPGGETLPSPRFSLRGPVPAPGNSRAAPGTVCMSVCLRPGMLYPTLGLRPADLLLRLVSMDDAASPARVAAFHQALDATERVEDWVDLFQGFLLDTLQNDKSQAMAASFLAAHQKLFAPLIDMALHFGIGQRQLERRVREVFGLSVRDTRRMARFGFTIMRFIGHQIAWGDLTRIAHEAGYYDQPHMTREFVELTGFSPAQLIQKISSADPAFWLYRIPPDQAHRLFMPVG